MAYSKLRNICSRKATKTQNTESLYIRAMACSLHLHPQLSLTETSNQVNVAKKWVLPPFSFQSRATIFHWERQVRRISRAPQLQVEEDKFHVFLEVSVAERFTQLHLNPGRSTPAMDGRNVVVESLSHSNFCDSMDCSSQGSSVLHCLLEFAQWGPTTLTSIQAQNRSSTPGDSGKKTEVLSHFSRVRLFATLWTVALQVSLSMGFSRQEY